MITLGVGEIRYQGLKSDGKTVVVMGATTSANPSHEIYLMTSFLELERAQRLRGVTIKPFALGSLVVSSTNVSLLALVRGWFRARAVIARRQK